jgi:hypothetical protein
MKSVRRWLEEDAGINLPISSLTSYISRIRRHEKSSRPVGTPAAPAVPLHTHAEPGTPALAALKPKNQPDTPDLSPHDPLAQAMGVLLKPRFDIRELHGDGDPRNKNLI